MILVFGSINIDLVARVAAIPRPGETVMSPRYNTVCGGKGANQAVAAARASRPGRVAMAGRIGADAFGSTARDNLLSEGVAVDLIAVGPEPTGCAFITVDGNGENAITVASGANATLHAADVVPTALASGVTVVCQMEVPFIQSLAVARRARTVGGRVLWNFAPVPADMPAGALCDIVAASDIFVVNEHEALAAAALLGFPTTDIDMAGQRLSRMGCVCVVTAGAQGAFAFFPDGRREAAAAGPVIPIDTTGAGDTFVGILASGFDEGMAFASALRRACHGASLACLGLGAQTSMPTRRALAAHDD